MGIKKIISICLVTALMLASAAFSVSGAEIVDNYYNANFNDGTFNNSASGLSFGRVAGSATVDYPQDAAKGNGAIRYTLSDTGAYVLRDNGFKPTALDTDKKVIWYEMSVKFEGHVCDLDLRATAAIFDINKDGSLYFTSLADSQGSYGPAKLAPVTIEADTWYHIKTAVDFADTVEIGGKNHPKFYAWVNGEFMVLDTTADCSVVWSSNINVSKTSAARLDFYAAAKEAGDAFMLDDIKIYTTQVPVKDEHGAYDFDPMEIYEGASVSSEKLKIDEATKTIYAQTGDTFGDISAMLTSTNGLAFSKNGLLADDDLAVTEAVGGKVFAKSSGGIGVKSYKIAEGMRLYDIDSASVKWEETTDDSTFSAITSASSLTKGDKVKLSFFAQNNTSASQDDTLVLAIYNNDMLVGCSITDFTVPVGGKTVESAPIEVTYDSTYYETENISVKAFIWNSKTDKTSVLKSIALK